MMKFKLSHAVALAAGGLLWAGNASAQYAPVGVQQNVPEATVTAGGWTVCYSGTFAESGTPIATILANCDQANIMYACRLVGDPNYSVLAQAPRADVFTDTGTGNVTTSSNGVEWYFNASYSFGFAPGGEAVTRGSCDTTNTGNNDRICVHTFAGNTNPGWRCGNNITGSAGVERVILESTLVPVVSPGIALGNPATTSPVLVAEELIIPPARTLTNTGDLNISTEVSYSFSPGEVRYARLHCPGIELDSSSVVTYGGDPSNLIGAVNTTPDGAIYFSITAGATPVVATDTLIVDGDRTIEIEQAIDCTYGLYDFPSQA
ncbi:hypothetical protein, partial [Arenimonas donghaensis]|uniref:hypothetical protein n=1 Tax=Arenimonas donghaensis TaxID=375061 RepID=UPI0005535938